MPSPLLNNIIVLSLVPALIAPVVPLVLLPIPVLALRPSHEILKLRP